MVTNDKLMYPLTDLLKTLWWGTAGAFLDQQKSIQVLSEGPLVPGGVSRGSQFKVWSVAVFLHIWKILK